LVPAEFWVAHLISRGGTPPSYTEYWLEVTSFLLSLEATDESRRCLVPRVSSKRTRALRRNARDGLRERRPIRCGEVG